MPQAIKYGRIIAVFLILSLCGYLIYLLYFYQAPAFTGQPTTHGYPPLSANATSQIKRGEYLAKISNCLSCHTGKNSVGAFSGTRQLQTPFGPIYSTNITPDNDTGIGLWSARDFKRAMTKGLSPTGKHYFPVFPYPAFSHMSDDDLSALFAYFKQIPAVKQQNRRQHLPYALPGARAVMSLWNKVYLQTTPLSPGKEESIARGKYLVRGPAHCSGCHTPLNRFGAPIARNFLSGAFIDGFYAPNITQLGLQQHSATAVSRSLMTARRLGDNSPYAGPMAEVTKHGLRYLTPGDALAIARYVKSLKRTPSLPFVPQGKPKSLARGKAVYQQVCVVCHRQGVMGAPRLGNKARFNYRIEHQGRDALYQRTIKGFNRMPAMGGCVECSKQDIYAAVDYLLEKSIHPFQLKDLSRLVGGKRAQ